MSETEKSTSKPQTAAPTHYLGEVKMVLTAPPEPVKKKGE